MISANRRLTPALKVNFTPPNSNTTISVFIDCGVYGQTYHGFARLSTWKQGEKEGWAKQTDLKPGRVRSASGHESQSSRVIEVQLHRLLPPVLLEATDEIL